MTRLEILRNKVDELYKANHPQADPWTDWGYDNHVLFVASLAEKIAKAQGANVEFAIAGALLHDIADSVMHRERPEHEAESLEMAGRLLQESGFDAKEAEHIVREIIEPHSCNLVLPTTLEGKILATADSAAHFMTDLYPLFCWRHYGTQGDYQAFRSWVARKIEKDFTRKIFFEDVRQEIQPRYEAIKLIFAD